MIQVSANTRVLVAVEPIDFRAGIDRIARVCKAQLLNDPFSGAVFVFRNRQATSIKMLAYNGQGFWLCQKRLSTGKFRYWPGRRGDVQHRLLAHELQVLLMGGDPSRKPTGHGEAARVHAGMHDSGTRARLEAAGVRVLDQPFHACGGVATAGGCLAAPHLATWLLWRLFGKHVAERTLASVAPVGEPDYLARVIDAISAFVERA